MCDYLGVSMVTRCSFEVAQWSKNLLQCRKWRQMCVQSLGREDPLKKGMGTHSSILAWRIPWTDHRVTKSCAGLKELSGHTYVVSRHVAIDRPQNLPCGYQEVTHIFRWT